MILFRCPVCGTAHRAEPQYAGGTIPCRHCGQQVPIPHASDPACALVYRAGEAEEGMPMTLDDVRTKLLSGELSETDLIWDNSTWKPLAKAFAEVLREAGPRLKPRAELRTDEPELQAPLVSMDAVQKVDLGEVEAERLTDTKKKRFQMSRRQEAGAEKQPGKAPVAPSAGEGATAPTEGPQAAAAAPKAARQHGRFYYGLQCVLLALAVVCGYKFGFGPLISHYRNTPSYVLVQNHEDTDYVATIGWRRAKEELYRRSVASFELWVGMPESQTLTITPREAGAAPAFSVRVPLRPGVTTLVNLKGKGEYGVYELYALADKVLDTPELKALAAEISANRAPDSAVKVSRQIRDLVAPAFKNTKSDTFFRSSAYDFEPAMLARLREHQKARGVVKAEEKVPAPKPAAPKPMVTFPAARLVPFANGSSRYDPVDRERVERAVDLPTTAITLGDPAHARVLAVSSPRLALNGDAKVLNLAMMLPRTTVDADGKTFTGQWDYRATCALEGKDANRWRWTWAFRGTAESAGKRYGLELKVEMDGKESRSVKPL